MLLLEGAKTSESEVSQAWEKGVVIINASL